MRSAEQANRELIRLRVLLVVLASMFAALLAVMWRVQVIHSSTYTKSLDKQSIRRIRLPGIRGEIYDRNGVCLAGNNPSYCIALYIEELRVPGKWENTIDKIETILNDMSSEFGMKRKVSRKNIANHIKRRLPLPFLAWKNISPSVISQIKESDTPLKGIDIYVEPVRTYPQGSLAAHLIGYVGRRKKPAQDTETPF